MTATAAPIAKDQELMLNGLVESASVNSIADLVSSNLNENEANETNETNKNNQKSKRKS